MLSLPRMNRAWRNALIATTALSVLALAAGQLWGAGLREWAFALSFLAVWTLISISWSTIDFNEESSLILAEIVDGNLEDLHERLLRMERELSRLQGRLSAPPDAPQQPANALGPEV